jgi:phosphate starvation-inducible membrane PsiE
VPSGVESKKLRDQVVRVFSRFEDLVYIGLGLMLAYSAGALLVTGAVQLVHSVGAGAPVAGILGLLDQALLILMFVELLYTVQVSFRAHALKPEPFLVVSLIAATRRILVVTAEFTHLAERTEAVFHRAMIEIGLLTLMVLALVVSLWMLRTRPAVQGGAEAGPSGRD